MTDFLGIFFPYDYAVRFALVVAIAAYGCYITLRAGVFAVPQAGIMAIGAYTSAILSLRYGVALPVAQFCGVVAGGFAGLLLALMLGRLDGIRLAIATIAFSEIVRILLLNIPITGGGVGLAGIARVTTDWQLVGATLICFLVFGRYSQTLAGNAMIALRVDPVVASHQGVSIFKYRLGVFVVSGVVSGLSGVLFAHLTGFLVPDNFGFAQLTNLLAATIVGGMGASIGPIIGSLIIVAIPELSGEFQTYRYVINGIIIVAVIAFAPGGVATFLKRPLSMVFRQSQFASHDKAVLPASTGPGVPSPPAAGGPVIDLHQVSKSYGGVQALTDVSFAVQPGELFGLIGPNGSGKTTLLNVLSGLTPPTSGHFTFEGHRSESFAGHANRVACQELSRTFQGIRLIGDLDLLANVVLGSYSRRTSGFVRQVLATGSASAEEAAFQSDARRLLAEVGIDNPDAASVAGLPYGVLRRIEIARALISRPRLLLLDEPAAGMTAKETAEIFNFMRELCGRGTSIIVVEHDVAAIARYCDRIAVLNFGRLLTVGLPMVVVRSPEVVEAYIGNRTRI